MEVLCKIVFRRWKNIRHPIADVNFELGKLFIWKNIIHPIADVNLW